MEEVEREVEVEVEVEEDGESKGVVGGDSDQPEFRAGGNELRASTVFRRRSTIHVLSLPSIPPSKSMYRFVSPCKHAAPRLYAFSRTNKHSAPGLYALVSGRFSYNRLHSTQPLVRACIRVETKRVRLQDPFAYSRK